MKKSTKHYESQTHRPQVHFETSTPGNTFETFMPNVKQLLNQSASPVQQTPVQTGTNSSYFQTPRESNSDLLPYPYNLNMLPNPDLSSTSTYAPLSNSNLFSPRENISNSILINPGSNHQIPMNSNQNHNYSTYTLTPIPVMKGNQNYSSSGYYAPVSYLGNTPTLSNDQNNRSRQSTNEESYPLVQYLEKQINEQNVEIITQHKKIEILVSQNVQFKKDLDQANAEVQQIKPLETELAKYQQLINKLSREREQQYAQISRSDKIQLYSPQKSNFGANTKIDESQQLIQEKEEEISDLQLNLADNKVFQIENQILKLKLDEMINQLSTISDQLIQIEKINQHLDDQNHRLQQNIGFLQNQRKEEYTC